MKTRFPTGVLALGVCLAAAEAQAQRGIAQGRVIDENGQAVAEVTVVFEFHGGFEHKYQTKTNKKGQYTQILTPGPYRITASKDNYQGAFLDQTIAGGAATSVPDLQIVTQETAVAAAIEQHEVLGPLKRAMELTQAGKLDEAEAAYKEVLAKDPTVPEAHYNLGSIYLGRKDWPAAEAAFRKVIELRADRGEAYVALSRVYEDTAQPDRAIEVMEKAVAARPDDPRMHFDLGVLCFNAKRIEQAESAFHKVEALDPQNVGVHYLLGTLAVNRGDIGEAVSRLEAYLAKAPEDAPDRDTAKGLLEHLKPKGQP